VAAFVVGAPAGLSSDARAGMRLNIFPGSATPSVVAADRPFWIGYGFLLEADGVETSIDDATGFALLVDGMAVPLETVLRRDGSRIVSKFAVADFPLGLPAGWHVLSGRWFDAGVLALASDATIEFVER